MCGIMGYTGRSDAVPVILDGLSKLEYRGYDSAGIAIHRGDDIEIIKRKGRLADLVQALGQTPASHLAIGHTRWATHGVPSDTNAHPHSDCSGQITLVHNGIIENYASLRKELMLEGHDFVSETDTEVLVHLVEKYYQGSLEQAVRQALTQVQGSFAIAAISVNEPHTIIAAKKDSPLIIGLGENEYYVASDIPAILGRTSRVYILEDNEFAVLTPDGVRLSDFAGTPRQKEVFEVSWDPVAAEKNGYEHFMLKEIHEQPEAVRQTLRGHIKDGRADFSALNLDELFSGIKKIYIVACGTAFHAGLVGRMAIEKLARIPVETDIASEFRYREILWEPDQLMIVISQSRGNCRHPGSLAGSQASRHQGSGRHQRGR